VDAGPLLTLIAGALTRARFDPILIGNAAAALHGAPVTTLDFDFFFRPGPANVEKLKIFATELDGVVLRPFYPVSRLYRVMNDDRGLQIDFMPAIHGVKSYNSLRSRSVQMPVGKYTLWVADLADIIASKRAANRARDRAVLEILEKTLSEKEENR
jgi:hypothetical protein